MPLMIEPLAMLPNEVRGGYQVDGNTDKIVTLVCLAAEMGADIIKADPTAGPDDFHRVIEAARVLILVMRGGARRPRAPSKPSRLLCSHRARGGWLTAATFISTQTARIVGALMEMVHGGAPGGRGLRHLPA